jgi:RNA polymerase sigma-70 factor (ECF subfamily)
MTPFTEELLVEGLPPASPDDKEMALAFQRGEKDAYQAIHERYDERVQRVCRRMLGKREDAQEAAQETFIRVYTALGKFNGRYQLGAWITRIATNVCLDHIRARSRRPVEATPLEELELDLLSTVADSDPEAVVVRDAESRRVRKVLLGLPPMHRAAIVLRDFEGLSYAEVGVALGMTECQVKALIHRARKGFRRSWTPLVEMLVPAKLLQRFRDVDVSVKEQVVNVAASQGAPVASVCSGLLQQCGTFMVERVAPLATTMILGGTAWANQGAPPASQPAETSVAQAQLAADVDEIDGIVTQRRTPPELAAPPSAAPSPTSAPGGAPAPTTSPSEAPAESPAPAPATASPPPPEGSVTPRTTPTPAPTPAPFLPVFYYQYGQSPTPRTPVSHVATVDCAQLSVSQSIVAEISDHEGSYPIRARLTTRGSTFEMGFVVVKKGFEVNYSGGGALISQSNTGNGLHLTFNGRYGTGPAAAESAGLPVNGSLRVELALDCTAQSLIAESVVLTTQ